LVDLFEYIMMHGLTNPKLTKDLKFILYLGLHTDTKTSPVDAVLHGECTSNRWTCKREKI